MNDWNVIECEGRFIALNSDEWNDKPEYNESWLIHSGLTRKSAIDLAIRLNNAVLDWRLKHEL